MTMLKTMLMPTVFCFLLSTVTVLQAEDRMRAGNWETTVIAADGKTATRNACLNAHDAAMSNGSPEEIRADAEKALAKSGSCKLKDFKIDAKSKTDTMVCGTDTIHNETAFHGGDGLETTTTHTSGSGVVTVAHLKGRRTGDCKPAE